MDAIDYDFGKFGFARRQDMALRALAFDNYTRRYLVDHPAATVVALAEGLQTSFYRLDATGVGDQFRWLTVDLPPIIELRNKLLPHSDRVSVCAQSALDFSWMDRVNRHRRSVHHRRGTADVSAARRCPGLDHRVRQTVPRRADDVRPAAALVRGMGASRHADLAALQGAADAVQPVGSAGGKPGEHGARHPRGARSAAAGRSRQSAQRVAVDGATRSAARPGPARAGRCWNSVSRRPPPRTAAPRPCRFPATRAADT